jgi:hypothetical protein
VLQPASEDWRAGLVARYGDEARLHYWASWADGGDLDGVDLDGPGRITELFGDVYPLLCEDEAKHMIQFRGMLQRVCRELNGQDWQRYCPVTDDFIVIPTDGSAHFCDEYPDVVQSVPPTRLDLLSSRGLGFVEDESAPD